MTYSLEIENLVAHKHGLEAENERLKAENAELRTMLDSHDPSRPPWKPWTDSGYASNLRAEIERLRAVLKEIAAKQDNDRYTVTPETAFEDFAKLNREICGIYDTAWRALNKQRLAEKKP